MSAGIWCLGIWYERARVDRLTKLRAKRAEDERLDAMNRRIWGVVDGWLAAASCDCPACRSAALHDASFSTVDELMPRVVEVEGEP